MKNFAMISLYSSEYYYESLSRKPEEAHAVLRTDHSG